MEQELRFLRVSTDRISNKEFYKRLEGVDKRGIVDVFCVLRDIGIRNIEVLGKAVALESEFDGYSSIDIKLGHLGEEFYNFIVADLENKNFDLRRYRIFFDGFVEGDR